MLLCLVREQDRRPVGEIVSICGEQLIDIGNQEIIVVPVRKGLRWQIDLLDADGDSLRAPARSGVLRPGQERWVDDHAVIAHFEVSRFAEVWLASATGRILHRLTH